jgi:hypothetical protein
MTREKALRLMKHNSRVEYTVHGENETVTTICDNDTIYFLNDIIERNLVKVISINGIK